MSIQVLCGMHVYNIHLGIFPSVCVCNMCCVCVVYVCMYVCVVYVTMLPYGMRCTTAGLEN